MECRFDDMRVAGCKTVLDMDGSSSLGVCESDDFACVLAR